MTGVQALSPSASTCTKAEARHHTDTPIWDLCENASKHWATKSPLSLQSLMLSLKRKKKTEWTGGRSAGLENSLDIRGIMIYSNGRKCSRKLGFTFVSAASGSDTAVWLQASDIRRAWTFWAQLGFLKLDGCSSYNICMAIGARLLNCTKKLNRQN